jgi:hypothetical protein
MTERNAANDVSARLEKLDARMSIVSGQQANILSALSMMLDTLRIQSKMLEQLMKYAREEPASSPLIESLDSMSRAIETMDGSVQAMSGQIEILPKAIGDELARSGALAGG